MKAPLRTLSRGVSALSRRRGKSLAGNLVFLAVSARHAGRPGVWLANTGLPRATEWLGRISPELRVLFDAAWYLQRYPDVARSELPPLRYFLRHGAAAGHDPSPVFRTGWYLARHPDVARAGINPFIHYLTGGYRSGASPCPLFDASWYLQQNPDVRRAGLEPLSHYLRHGEAEGRAPHPLFNPEWYHTRYPDVRANGMTALWHYLAFGAQEGREPSKEFNAADYLKDCPAARVSPLSPLEHYIQSLVEAEPNVERACANVQASDVWREHFPQLGPLHFFAVPRLAPRLTMVTDRLDRTGLFGGVATSIILATLLAKRRGMRLRIITRHARPEPGDFRRLLAAHGLTCAQQVEFEYCPLHDPTVHADVGEEELFLTTSWWSTWDCLQAVHPRRIVYLLQEDERAFYAAGDTQLRCQEVLANRDITFVLNTRGLQDFLVGEGFDNIAARGTSFEPCFPRSLFFWQQPRPRKERRVFFFYCRPQHPRNIFLRGLEAINDAIASNVLDPQEWEFHCAGAGVPRLLLAGNVRPRVHESLTWKAYAELARRVDLGLSLMLTPHPSYPPLDLAACGAAVVTNTYANKQSLAHISRNIICAPPDRAGLQDGLQRGVALARNERLRRAHYDADHIGRDWEAAMAPTLDYLDGRR